LQKADGTTKFDMLRAEKRQCAGDFEKLLLSTRRVNHVKIRGNDGQKIFLRESVR
jgi:hypothetical protein